MGKKVRRIDSDEAPLHCMELYLSAVRVNDSQLELVAWP